MFEIHSYCNGSRNYDGNAHIIVSNAFGLLELFTIHPNQPESRRPNYHRTQIGSFSLRQSLEVFRDGLQWFGNSRDLAKESRDELIKRANKIANVNSVGVVYHDSACGMYAHDSGYRFSSVED